MAAELTLTPEAENDVAEAFAWYEDRRPGLGEEFLSSVDASLQSILRTPEGYAYAHGPFRRCLLRRFPYAVFYEYADRAVTVYAVFHTARDPNRWRKRVA